MTKQRTKTLAVRRMVLLCFGCSAAVFMIFTNVGATRTVARPMGSRSQAIGQQRLTFEVASVKLSPNEGGGGTGQLRVLPGGRLSTESAILRFLIQSAYHVRSYQVVGGPEWIESARWNIEAKAEDNANQQQVMSMLQSLLEDRFKLKIHHETQELPVYDLTAAKNNGTIQPPKDGSCITPDPTAPPSPPSPPSAPGAQLRLPCGQFGASMGASGSRIDGYKIVMANLCQILSNLLGRPVIDKTGFTGVFDVHLLFANDDTLAGLAGRGPRASESSADPELATIFTAIQEQLGLKLESTTGPVEVVVVDHVEKSSGE